MSKIKEITLQSHSPVPKMTRSVYHQMCFTQRAVEPRNSVRSEDSALSTDNGAIAATAKKTRQLEAKLNAVIVDFNVKSKQYDAKIKKLTSDFDAERKTLVHTAIVEREKRLEAEAQLKKQQSAIIAELQSTICDLKHKNELKDHKIIQLERKLVDSKQHVNDLEKHLDARTSFRATENIRAAEIFKIFNKYIVENQNVLKNVEYICGE